MDERLNEINRELKELNEALARQGLACYVEPGIWIAAEHEDEYMRAL